MWQTIAAILIVALAAWFVIRRLGRQLSGKNAACCGGGEGGAAGAGESPCAGCAGASSPQGLALNHPGPACGCGCSPGQNQDSNQ